MRRLLPILMLFMTVGAAQAGASTVTYIQGDSIWLASTDGSQKSKLSGPAGDGRDWREVTQSDNGRVLAVRREAGKIAPLNTFTLWGPDGKEIYQGYLNHKGSGTSYAYPVSLDLTADGRNVVYGYSILRGFYPSTTLDTGTYILYADRVPASEPFQISSAEWPTTVGSRVVSSIGSDINIQDQSGATPFSEDFTPWVSTAGTGLDLARTDVAANGSVAAAELTQYVDGTQTEGRIAMLKSATLGSELLPGDCYLPIQGLAGDASLSQDGKLIAWQDDRGVVVAGIPDFSGAEPCNLTSPPVVISATGKMPSIGAAKIPDDGNPGGGGGGGGASDPVITPPAKVKSTALRSGVFIKVRVKSAGLVKVTGQVKGKVVATGSVKAKQAGVVKVKLKAVKAFRSKLASYVGKTITIKVTVAGRSDTLKLKLR